MHANVSEPLLYGIPSKIDTQLKTTRKQSKEKVALALTVVLNFGCTLEPSGEL